MVLVECFNHLLLIYTSIMDKGHSSVSTSITRIKRVRQCISMSPCWFFEKQLVWWEVVLLIDLDDVQQRQLSINMTVAIWRSEDLVQCTLGLLVYNIITFSLLIRSSTTKWWYKHKYRFHDHYRKLSQFEWQVWSLIPAAAKLVKVKEPFVNILPQIGIFSLKLLTKPNDKVLRTALNTM